MRSPSVFYVGFLQQRGLMSMGDYPNFFQSNTTNPDCQGVMVPPVVVFRVLMKSIRCRFHFDYTIPLAALGPIIAKSTLPQKLRALDV